MAFTNLKMIAAAALFAGVGLFTTGQNDLATPVATCPDNATLSRTFTLDPSAGCYAYGQGNINGNIMQDPILNGATVGGNAFNLGAGSAVIPGLVLLDTSDGTGSVLDGAIGGAVDDSKSGTLAVAGTTTWTNLILAIKVGNNSDPTWAAFFIAGNGSFDFTITPAQGSGLSHVQLYGVSAVPLPAAGFLLIGALGSLVGSASQGGLTPHSDTMKLGAAFQDRRPFFLFR